MDSNDWKCELHRLFEIFERESTIWLRKINRCFGMLGRPFGDEFRRYFLKMSAVRLDSCFNAVLMEPHLNEMQMPMPSTSSGQNDGDKFTSNSNNRGSAKAKAKDNVDFRNRCLLGWRIENGVHIPIGITDSDDDSVEAEEYVGRREVNDAIDEPMESNATQNTEKTKDSANDKEGDADLNVEQNVEVFVKFEPKAEIEEEMVDLPFEMFDPNKENESFDKENRASVPDSMDNRIPARTSSKRTDGKRFKCKRCEYTSKYKRSFIRHQLVHDESGVKPFKCEHCNYASKYQHAVQTHQRVHEQQELLGVVYDSSNGLYKCTHCDQRFTKWHNLKQHMTLSHKNNQRLFNCLRCKRRFTQKTEKDRHEVQCQNRRYECYLCKAYITRDFNRMQHHLRTHSGAKPFECSICMKCFRSKNNLKSHLNYVHSRISA